ncbi:hypothetical protein PHYBOEH_001658 [Phytophthora boehmeriae]|uniref:Uncharacterized protein n=1 Tax=Phytophthora boehmeriae TaxID=109152 RepID=A0A8T1WVT1_9STRA|nr:hypothetical protein PHYBOEH_001658 [Phytophthora boehmeriae]
MADDGHRNTGAGNVPAPTEADAGSTYAEDLERWALYDCSGLRAPLADEDMQDLFHRCRVARSKSVTATRTVTMQSLDAAWTSFVRRWNVEGPVAFIRGLERREVQHRARSVSALAKQIHDASYDNDRDCCFVHYVRECAECRGYNRPRPDEAAWKRLLTANPLTVTEEGLIARYQEEQRRRRAAVRQQQRQESDWQQHDSWQRGQAEQQQQRWDRLLRLEHEMTALRDELTGTPRDPPQHLGRRSRADDWGAGWDQRRWG